MHSVITRAEPQELAFLVTHPGELAQECTTLGRVGFLANSCVGSGVMGKRGSRTLGAILLCCVLLLLFVWVTSLYQLVAGHVVNARVLSCHYKSCDVAWVDGNAHGVNSTDGLGARPGDVVKVFHVPGHGVTSREGVLLTVWLIPGFVVFIVGVVMLSRHAQRRRQASHSAGST